MNLEIRNQDYDEKANTVTITVVCCNPEKIRDKLCCKCGKTIKSIEIIPQKTIESETKVDKTKKGKETKVDKTKEEKETQKEEDKSGESERSKEVHVCCGQCYEGHYGGPCYQWYGRPISCYDGYGYRYEYCEKNIYYVCRCNYFNEENTSVCTIM